VNPHDDSKSDRELERLLEGARYQAPPGMAARLAAGARDPEEKRILFWADVERTSRSLLGKAAAAAVLAAGLALAVAVSGNPDNAGVAAFVDQPPGGYSGGDRVSGSDVTLDQVARLAVSPAAFDAFVRAEESSSGAAASSDDADSAPVSDVPSGGSR
jgi:hypothetical protein